MAIDSTLFDTIYPWSDIKTETIDGQDMVWIPKFYYRVHTPTTGPYAGKKCWEVSDGAADGFVVHPAFMKAGVEIDGFYVGAYEASSDASDSTKAASVVGKTPLTSINLPTMKTRCSNRGTGWHLWNVNELGAIQMLCLIEAGTSDSQKAFGSGYGNNYGTLQLTGSTTAVWRGIHEIWGNAEHCIDGCSAAGATYHQIHVLDNKGNGTDVYIGENLPDVNGGYPYSMSEAKGASFDMNALFIIKVPCTGTMTPTYPDLWSGVYGQLCHGGCYGEPNDHLGVFTTYFSAGLETAGNAITGFRLAKN